uniref:Beta-amylase n=1 Tax=Tanacetum cinerariifolium TaxID=118510 RepID=A0A6L2MGR6_TANCI|nr:inactive beta-amylase 9 [Tanacetum cinerariifolium]
MSIIAKIPVSSRKLSQLGDGNINVNIVKTVNVNFKNQKMGFGQMVKCHKNLGLRVSAQFVNHVQAADVSPVTDHKDGVKLYVGLPMNSISECNAINHSKAISAGLRALKLLGVEGVELPIWWGVAEKESMGKYEWSGYLSLVDMIQESGLKLHVSLCFHASKEENIPLPKWIREVGESQPDIFFADRSGKRYKECLSFGVDDVPVFDGKTAMQVYKGFVESFKTVFAPFMASTITGITIGLGPDGELRYPSHHDQTKDGFGAGEFQCYDKNMMNDLNKDAQNLENPLWGLCGPHDAPTYNQNPLTDTFFKEGGSWETRYGDFFLAWYSTQLISHADRMLSLAASSLIDTTVMVSGKLPLIHSWYKTRSHPAEVTAGFYNTINKNGYEEIAKIFGKNSCKMILPGMDLLDEQQPNGSFSSPELLLEDIRDTCRNHDVVVCGQNLHVAGSVKSFEQIKKNLAGENEVELFLYQRMGVEGDELPICF